MASTRSPGLGRLAAVPLAFGSIAGSGILSLPSAVYSEAGSASLVVWLVAAGMCVPMLLMFQDAMRLSGTGDALQTLVTRGLQPWVGAAMPLMFLFVVVVGLPTGCLVAGRYVERGLHWPGAGSAVAAALLLLTLIANSAGRQVGGVIQFAGSGALVITGVFLIISGLDHATQPIAVVPTVAATGHVLPGVLLAFWAFVGFENLTFLGRELRHPARDFLPVSVTALALYGAFAIALTLTIAACVQQNTVDPIVGLLQLATNPAVQAGVALVALTAMLINSAAWVRGVDSLIAGAGRDGQLPVAFHDHRSARTLLLTGLFAITLVVLSIAPHLIVDALAASSAVFVLIYLVCIVAYLRTLGLTLRTGLNALLIPVMTITLVQSGSRSVYGVVVATGCLIWCRRTTKGNPRQTS